METLTEFHFGTSTTYDQVETIFGTKFLRTVCKLFTNSEGSIIDVQYTPDEGVQVADTPSCFTCTVCRKPIVLGDKIICLEESPMVDFDKVLKDTSSKECHLSCAQ